MTGFEDEQLRALLLDRHRLEINYVLNLDDEGFAEMLFDQNLSPKRANR